MSFEEATYSSLLTEPLIVRGVLRFRPPATLKKKWWNRTGNAR